MITHAVEWAAVIADSVGVFVVLLGFAIAVVKFIPTLLRPSGMETIETIQSIRCTLGTYIVFALELMIVSDLLHSVISRSLEDLYYLGGIVVLRTAISYFLNKEIQEIEHMRKNPEAV